MKAAAVLASKAHEGQVDKNGEHYILHSSRVAGLVRGAGAVAVAVAWLHDVIEDAPEYEAEVRTLGAEVYEAVLALTHSKHESNVDYINRVKANPLARVVKLADIADNSDEARLSLLPTETAERLRAKYARALAQLSDRVEL